MAKRKAIIDNDKANKAVGFIRRLMHTKGRWAGVPFNLQPWQESQIIRPLFGTLNNKGHRQYRTCFVSIPRKNGKSEIGAAIALYLLLADSEPGAEIYSAAADREQASIVFNVAAQMIRQSPELMSRTKIIDSQKRIITRSTGSFYRAISADAYTKHGFSAHGIIFDELHAQPSRDLWDVLTTSTGSRTQPLVFAITTAGYDRQSICWEVHEYAEKIIKGLVEDKTFLPIIYQAPSDANWLDEKVWHGCNPALGDFRNIDEMRQLASRAQEIPALQNTFRRLYLNQWTSQVSRWIDLALWDTQAGLVIEEHLKGRLCYGGLDLSSVADITAWVMVFPDADDPETIDVLCRFWCPMSRLVAKHNKYQAQYQLWVKQGWLKTTPGDAVDYDFIKTQIMRDAAVFDLVDLNIDRLFQGAQVGMELQKEGLTVVGMGQGFMSMAMPMAEFERRLLRKKIRHGGNPILRWMADNVSIKQDPAGNKKSDKATSQGKIDGIVALVMALDRAIRHEDKCDDDVGLILL